MTLLGNENLEKRDVSITSPISKLLRLILTRHMLLRLRDYKFRNLSLKEKNDRLFLHGLTINGKCKNATTKVL